MLPWKELIMSEDSPQVCMQHVTTTWERKFLCQCVVTQPKPRRMCSEIALRKAYVEGTQRPTSLPILMQSDSGSDISTVPSSLITVLCPSSSNGVAPAGFSTRITRC